MPPSVVPRLDSVLELLLLLPRKLDFLVRENMFLVNICILSGRSPRGAIVLAAFDRIEDFLDGMLSLDGLLELCDWKEKVPDEFVSLLDRCPKTELLLTDAVYSLICSGEGGPSIAGSSENGCMACRGDVGKVERDSFEDPNPNILRAGSINLTIIHPISFRGESVDRKGSYHKCCAYNIAFNAKSWTFPTPIPPKFVLDLKII